MPAQRTTATNTPVRVLLVDDHEMFLQSLVRVLEDEADIRIAGAVGSVGAALGVAQEAGADVAVVDYWLPDGDGISLATRLTQDVPRARVLLLTGSGNEGLAARAIEAGCAGFLTKDRAVDELVRAIRALAAGDTWISASTLSSLVPRVLGASTRIGHDLSPREIEVLYLAAQGLANASIADALFLSVNTVRNHMQSAITKLGAHSKLEAVAIAVREGIITYPSG